MASEDSLELLAESTTLDGILHELEPLGVNVVLLGVRSPVTEGVRDLQKLRERCPGIETVVFATPESGPFLKQFLLAGARGYVPIDCGHQDLVDAVRGADRGKSAQVPADLVVGLLQSLSSTVTSEPCLRTSSRTARLTARELEVLQEMATGGSYRSIGESLCLAESTVKKYAHSVITKLGASNRSTAVIHAFRLNLLKERTSEKYEFERGLVN